MAEYTKYLMRHGECGLQAIIEQMERARGAKPQRETPLEQRWDAAMRHEAAFLRAA